MSNTKSAEQILEEFLTKYHWIHSGKENAIKAILAYHAQFPTYGVEKVKGRDITASDVFWWEADGRWQVVEKSMLNGVFFEQDKTFLRRTPKNKPMSYDEFYEKYKDSYSYSELPKLHNFYLEIIK